MKLLSHFVKVKTGPRQMLIPVVVFLVMGEHRTAAMKSMRTWLMRNKRMINVVVMGIFGILMLILGLTRIF
jgi:hypothetical protein